jgi:hypothetical protein
MGRGRRRREGEAVFSIGQEAELQSNPWFPQTRQWSSDTYKKMSADCNRRKALHLPIFSSLVFSFLFFSSLVRR